MKALILSNDKETKALIQRTCQVHQPALEIIQPLPGMQSDVGLITLNSPDVVVIDANGYGDKSLEIVASMTQKYPKAFFMLLSSDRSSEMLIEAMRLGVREVVALPIVLPDLQAALQRITEKISTTEKKEGKLLSFLSCKGGSGTTFIAANLAYALSALGRKRVLLIDLNQQFGDAALYVSDLKASLALSDVCNSVDRMDLNLLESSVLHVTPNFNILASSDQVENSADIHVDQFSSLLQFVRQHYDFTIMDLGRQINPINVRALDVSDFIYPIFQQSLPFLRNGRRLFEIFSALGYRQEKIQIVINRFESSASLDAAEYERVLGQRVAHRIPNNHEVVNESINQGLPVLQMARSSPITKSLVEWVNGLVDISTPSTTSLIRRIFVRNSAPLDLFR
ncbi:MAG: AAA family ATPase [Oxalobacteraceae bacterium]|nr:AAA family ATPase [Oxalobacteraceae bacterium]